MPAGQFNCPSCNILLKTGQPQPPGTKIKCPKCLTIFLIEEAMGKVAAPAVVHVTPRAPADAGRPRYEQNDYDAPVADQAPVRRKPRYESDEYGEQTPRKRRRGDISGLSSDYRVDLGKWFEYATAHYSAVLGPMIGFTLILGAVNILSAIPYLGLLIGIFVLIPMQAGFTAVCLRQLKGKRWAFGDFFTGFQHYGALILNQLLVGLICFACMLPSLLVFLLAALLTAGMRGGPPVFILGAVLFSIANALAVFYVGVRIQFFSTGLILDRGCNALEAVQGSWTLSRGHFWGLFAVSLVLGLLQLLGALMCFVGLFFTTPLCVLTLTAGYLFVAGTKRPVKPNAYREDLDEDRHANGNDRFRE